MEQAYVFNIIVFLPFLNWPLLEIRAEICKKNRWFFGVFEDKKKSSDINWPLDARGQQQELLIVIVNGDKVFVKIIYSEKTTKFCEISTVDLTVTT